MRVAILGATGPTGQQLVEQALDGGHQVVAVIRNPDKMLEHVKANQNYKAVKVCRCSVQLYCITYDPAQGFFAASNHLLHFVLKEYQIFIVYRIDHCNHIPD